ncbi:MAG: glycerol-3-phosphate 1-O-acyltransferase PlsY [Clostridia bacterium]|nr:glycerol-3-phosphate 1-O-acyltransferase PlsY [Clostridia bacterium]
MANTVVDFIIVFLISYLLGSISTSILLSKIKTGKDIRDFGSGNAGATNTLRTLGKGAAVIVLLGDMLKAVISILIAKAILNEQLAVYVASIGVVLGHNFPVYFGFKGGKGVAVSAVACLFADWRIGVFVIILSLLIMITTKYVSLGSIIGAILTFLLGFIFRGVDIPYIIFSIIIGGLAIIMHRKNIARLLNGNENKLSFSKGGKQNG